MPTTSCETLHVISFETATTCCSIKQATHDVGAGGVTMAEAEEDLVAYLWDENKATVALYVFAATTIWSNIIVSKNKGTKPNIFFISLFLWIMYCKSIKITSNRIVPYQMEFLKKCILMVPANFLFSFSLYFSPLSFNPNRSIYHDMYNSYYYGIVS